MGEVDIERQKPNVFRMKLLGAEVVPALSGSRTLKDALNEALRDWVANVEDTFYCIGTVAGPHPYPEMVRDFQCVIGNETKKQMLQREGRLPSSLVAAIGGGSNAMGLFHPFLDDKDVEIYGVEAAGNGLNSGKHAASITGGRPGVLHGNRTYILMDDDGQITGAHSIIYSSESVSQNVYYSPPPFPRVCCTSWRVRQGLSWSSFLEYPIGRFVPFSQNRDG